MNLFAEMNDLKRETNNTAIKQKKIENQTNELKNMK
jgi:hypothetical protein